MLLSLLALGACNTARVLGEDATPHADLSAVHSIDLATLQKLTAFPSCVTSCATGAHPHPVLSRQRTLVCAAGLKIGLQSFLGIFSKALVPSK